MDHTSTGNGAENTDASGAGMGMRDLEEDLLAGLQTSLAGRVASLDIVPERGSLFLKVVAKGPEKASADIWVASADDVWWFWWGVQSARRFGRADDPDGAAETVLRELGGER